jgi:Ca2+-binding RTX toxin-like protein
LQPYGGELTEYFDGSTYQPLPGDTINGGLGDDTYYVQFNDVISDPGGVDTVLTDVTQYTLPSGFENLTYTTFGFSDGEGIFVKYAGNNLDNVITVGGLYINSGSILDGGDGNDTLVGSGGTSTFRFSLGSGNYGHDYLYGAGAATIDFADARSALVADLATGTLTGGGTAGSGSATLVNISNVIGGAFNDRIVGSPTGIGGYYGQPADIFGGAGNDTIEGASGAYRYDLHGGDGNDRLVARGPQDHLEGGTGADQFVFARAPGGDPVGYYGDAVIRDFLSGADKIVLDGAYMSALGPSGNFAAGDARFYAAAGATSGHDADDRIVFNTSTNEFFYDADGSGAAAARIIGNLQPGATLVATDIAVENGTASPPPPPPGDGQTINGTTGNDSLIGTAGNDTIKALAGHDTLAGGDGNDWLQGGGWSDTMTGGAGADSYVFEAAGTATVDRVTDFATGTDELVFDNLYFTALGTESAWAAGDTRFYAAAGAVAGHDTDDRLIYNTSTGSLYYDPDGSGASAAQIVATFQGNPAIAASDVTVI